MVGVKVVKIDKDKLLLRKVYDLMNLDVDVLGYVIMLNVNVLNEMVDMMVV